MAALQWIYGDTKPLEAPFTSSQVFFVGDLVARATDGTIYRAEDESWVSNEATTRDNFVSKFIGVVEQKKRAADVQPYGNSAAVARVSTDGTFEADLDTATTLIIGDWVGPNKASGNALVSQVVKKVTAGDQAIGFVVEAGTSLTRCKFRLMSKLTPGGPSNTFESGT